MADDFSDDLPTLPALHPARWVPRRAEMLAARPPSATGVSVLAAARLRRVLPKLSDDTVRLCLRLLVAYHDAAVDLFAVLARSSELDARQLGCALPGREKRVRGAAGTFSDFVWLHRGSLDPLPAGVAELIDRSPLLQLGIDGDRSERRRRPRDFRIIQRVCDLCLDAWGPAIGRCVPTHKNPNGVVQIPAESRTRK